MKACAALKCRRSEASLKAACGSGCDARRVSTGRFVRSLEAHYADDNAQAQSGVEEQQDRRRPRLSEGMRRPHKSYSDMILRLTAESG
jgi:hypothetical protein